MLRVQVVLKVLVPMVLKVRHLGTVSTGTSSTFCTLSTFSTTEI